MKRKLTLVILFQAFTSLVCLAGEYEDLIARIPEVPASTAVVFSDDAIEALDTLKNRQDEFAGRMLEIVRACPGELDSRSESLLHILAQKQNADALELISRRASEGIFRPYKQRLAYAELLREYPWEQAWPELRTLIRKDDELRPKLYRILERYGKEPPIEWVKVGIRADFWASRSMECELGVTVMNKLQKDAGTRVLADAIREQLKDEPLDRLADVTSGTWFLLELGHFEIVGILLDAAAVDGTYRPFRESLISDLDRLFGGGVVQEDAPPADAVRQLRAHWDSIRDQAAYDEKGHVVVRKPEA